MKSKFTLLLSVSCLLQSLCFGQNAAPVNLPQNVPHFVKELAKGAPPELLLQTDPGLYNHLQKRRMAFTALLYKEVKEGRLPDSLLKVLSNVADRSSRQPQQAQSLTNANSSPNFEMVKDINTITDSYPSNNNNTLTNNFATIGNTIYFRANDGLHGSELWCSNGTESGTRLVKDIYTGTASSDPLEITVYKGKLYFSAFSDDTGRELYQSDGTESGTILLKDIYVGTQSSAPGMFKVAGSFLYFISTGGLSYKNQIWKTNGTTTGTRLVMDISEVFDANDIAQVTSVDDQLYFTAYSEDYGRELWTSNGTSGGTFMLKDINTYNNNNYSDCPSNLTAFNHKLYFIAHNSYHTLWESDGTATGTHEVKKANGITITSYYFYYYNQPLATTDSAIFFSGITAATGNELYKYTVAAGVKLVKDLVPGSMGSSISSQNIRTMNNKVYFPIESPDYHFSFWQSDGTKSGTSKVADLPGYFSLYNFFSVGSNLYFSVDDSLHGEEPWISDGTTNGTRLLKDVNNGKVGSSSNLLTLAGNKIYFAAYTTVLGVELWQTKSSGSGTQLVKDINTVKTADALSYQSPYNNYKSAAALNDDKIVFNARTPEAGSELWVSDGTGNGTFLIDLFPGYLSSYPSFYYVKKGKAYFTGVSSNYTEDIFVTDGTVAGTKNIGAIPYGFVLDMQVTDNGSIFFLLLNNTNFQYELWETKEKESMVQLYPNCGSEIATAGNNCFFVSSNATYGNELWKSNGTSSGTRMVMDMVKGSGSSYPSKLTALKNKIIFQAYADSYAYGLWASDGTKAGTVYLNDIYSNSGTSTAIIGDNLYFSGYNYEFGAELYKTNGTAAGTKIVKDLYLGENSSNPFGITNVNDTLFFMAGNEVNPVSLWKTNGTNNSTTLVKAFNPANYYVYQFSSFTSGGGKLYFLRNDTLWYSQGTNTTTQPVTGKAVKNIQYYGYLIGTTNTMFLNGNSYFFGYELYSDNVNGKSLNAVNTINISTPANSKLSATLLANPFINDIVININSEKPQHLQVSVYDASGKKILSNDEDVSTGSSNIHLNASQLARGVYIISVSNGAETINLKAIK